jgi:hypothetical protein
MTADVLDLPGVADSLRIVVTGDRHWNAYQVVFDALSEAAVYLLATVTVQHPVRIIVIHGGATGADAHASIAAHALDFEVEVHNPNWDRYGNAAGPMRNEQMMQRQPQLVLAFHDYLPGSKGTAHAVATARAQGITVWLHDSHGERQVVQ